MALAEESFSKEGQLARMVRELHTLEDDVVAKLTAAERLLGQLESRRVREDGGYSSRAEFEDRMLACTPALLAMRGAVPKSPGTGAKLSVAKREHGDARARQTKALTAIARAIDRLRAIDGEICQSAAAARTTLSAIDEMRIFEECGYESFEEFLERALGPSPVLASVVALVANGAAERTEEPQAPGDASSIPAEEPSYTESSTSFFEEPSQPFTQPVDDEPKSGTASAGDDEAQEGGEANANVPHSPARRRLAGIVVSVILCAVATVAGAAAGVWTGVAANGQGANGSAPDASVAPNSSSAVVPREPSATARPASPAVRTPDVLKPAVR